MSCHFEGAVRTAIRVVAARVHEELRGLCGSTHLEGNRHENEAKDNDQAPRRPRQGPRPTERTHRRRPFAMRWGWRCGVPGLSSPT